MCLSNGCAMQHSLVFGILFCSSCQFADNYSSCIDYHEQLHIVGLPDLCDIN